MPKKKQALPTPKAKLYTEDAALLVPIFQKEPFITFQELQDKYGDILTDQQIYRGPVSYTHLDVYKRQAFWCPLRFPTRVTPPGQGAASCG